MRGGPEPLMVTGWAQIMVLDPSYIGDYHCIATNTQGQVTIEVKCLLIEILRNTLLFSGLCHGKRWRVQGRSLAFQHLSIKDRRNKKKNTRNKYLKLFNATETDEW